VEHVLMAYFISVCVNGRVLLAVHLDLQQLVVWTRMLTYSKLLEEAWSCWLREIAANRFPC